VDYSNSGRIHRRRRLRMMMSRSLSTNSARRPAACGGFSKSVRRLTQAEHWVSTLDILLGKSVVLRYVRSHGSNFLAAEEAVILTEMKQEIFL
jgi:hypothetical protein